MATPKPLKLLDVSAGRPMLDRYELIAELAAGGMATVFLARIGGAGGFERFVAIKRLHPHLAHEQEFVEMFLDEARMAARIHHPNVVPILEVGTSEQGYYLVMDYIEGDTLGRVRAIAKTAARPVPIAVTLRVVVDTLSGLHAAHELVDDAGQPMDLVHRDVSPQNILLGIDGTSRITDFGVARASTRLSSTRSGQLKGKLAYMAPEQVLGGPIDRRADVFAAGVVLWEQLAGKHLFRGESDAVTMNRVLTSVIPTLCEVSPDVPPALDAAVMRALARDPAERYASCADFADALEHAAGSSPIAPAREVAVFLDSLLGASLTERRDSARTWLAATEPGRPSTRPSGYPALVSEHSAPTGGRRRAIALTALALGAVAVAVAGWRLAPVRPAPSPALADTARPPLVVASVAPSASAPAASAAPAVSASVTAATLPAASPRASAGPPASSRPAPPQLLPAADPPIDDMAGNPYR